MHFLDTQVMNMKWCLKLILGYGYDLLILLCNVFCHSDNLGLEFDSKGLW